MLVLYQGKHVELGSTLFSTYLSYIYNIQYTSAVFKKNQIKKD